MSDLQTQNIKRVIVRGTNWVGDAVMTVPALRLLRSLFPDANITLATRSWAKGLFADVDFIDDLLIHDENGLRSLIDQVRSLKGGNFDLALVFPNSFQTALLPALARIPFRVGYATERRAALLTHPIELPEWRSTRHEIYYYLNLVEQLAARLNQTDRIRDIKPNASLSISNVRNARALELLRSKGVVEGQPVVALCPGSINSRAKRWPEERFAAVADSLIQHLNAQVLLIGSREELDVSQRVQNQMTQKPVVLTGETDLAELVAILNQVDLLITNDTGPAHIASALERPTLVIFGPTNPLTTKPFSDGAQMIRQPPDCAPCMLRDCPIDHRCMTAITADQVFDKARAMLSSKVESFRALVG